MNKIIKVDDFYAEFFLRLKELCEQNFHKTFCPLFRGHSKSAWSLMPTIGRGSNRDKLIGNFENSVFRTYWSEGLPFLKNETPWSILFSMRHHSVPTRLLDWTSSINIALYFALDEFDRKGTENMAVWVLDPQKLNEKTIGGEHFFNPLEIMGNQDLRYDYQKFLVDQEAIKPDVFALMPPVVNERIAAQHCYFTFHRNLKPLEELYPDYLTKIEIDKSQYGNVGYYLRGLSDLNPFRVFPDLDGLGKKINEEFF
jgi:hypothetical protein